MKDFLKIDVCPGCNGTGRIKDVGDIPKNLKKIMPLAPSCGTCKGKKKVIRFRFPVLFE